MEPITVAKVSIARALGELGVWASVSAVALTMTTEEVGLGVTVFSLFVGIVVWAVRIQVTVQNQGTLIERMDRRLEKIADHIGVVE
jgi:hypothetical protein